MLAIYNIHMWYTTCYARLACCVSRFGVFYYFLGHPYNLLKPIFSACVIMSARHPDDECEMYAPIVGLEEAIEPQEDFENPLADTYRAIAELEEASAIAELEKNPRGV